MNKLQTLLMTTCVAVAGMASAAQASVILAPGHTWEYTFTDPTADPAWNTTTGGWATGAAPFGNTTAPYGSVSEFIANTWWAADGSDGDDLWVRTAIDLTGFDLATAAWNLGTDNGFKLYANGTLVGAGNAEGFTYRWEYGGGFGSALTGGTNIIAVALEDHGGLTAFDMQVTADVAVPEPATLALFGLGLFGLGFAAHRARPVPAKVRATRQ